MDTFFSGNAAKTLGNFTQGYENGNSKCGGVSVGGGACATLAPGSNVDGAYRRVDHSGSVEEVESKLLLQ